MKSLVLPLNNGPNIKNGHNRSWETQYKKCVTATPHTYAVTDMWWLERENSDEALSGDQLVYKTSLSPLVHPFPLLTPHYFNSMLEKSSNSVTI